MNIYALCVDPEMGQYLAVSTSDHRIFGISYVSVEEAVGRLVAANPGVTIDQVISLDELRKSLQ